MIKKNLIFTSSLIFFLFLFVSTGLAYPDSSVKMLERFHISLGNSSCRPLECDITTLMFYVPADKGSQDVRLTVTPECFNYTFGGGEQWNLTIFCLDGSLHSYNMKDAMCDYDQSYVFDISVNSSGFSFFGERQFQQFWCAFQRPSGNTENLPTEFKVLVDGVGLHSKYADDTQEQSFQSQIGMATSLESFVTLNLSVWGILYSMFLVGAILTGIGFVLGFVPIALRYVIRKVVED